MTRSEIEAQIGALALEAGARIMEIYSDGTLDMRLKGDDSPVTAADLAANTLISNGLAESFADIPCVTEEEASTHAAHGHPRFFLVDPLDGTREFIEKRGDFTVNIALIEGGAPVLGVVYAPARGRMFATRSGKAVESAISMEHKLQEAKQIEVAKPDNSALRIVASKSHRDQATDDLIARYSVGSFKSAGSSLKFCLLAAGEADFYPRLGRTMEWDTAAGHAVLRAAGGNVVRFDDRSVLSYGKPNYENPHFIAMVPGVELR